MRYILPIVLLALICAPAFADDAFIGCTGDPVTGTVLTENPISITTANTRTYEHNDQDAGYGFKGWATIYVVNDTDTAWSDFHFSLFEVVAPRGVIWSTANGNNPVFKIDGAAVPTTGYNWTIDNSAPGGPTLDMVFGPNYFVQQGQMAMFKLYTDNTAYPNTKFGLAMYPTSDYVPEPSSLMAFGTALIGFAGLALRRRH